MNLSEKICRAIRDSGYGIDADTGEKFAEYLRFLSEYNRSVNLTAITGEAEIIDKHFVDSLAAAEYIPEGAAVLDIGHAIIVCIVPWYISYIAIELLSGAIRGTGKSLIPTIICIFGICVLRTAWIYVVPYITPTLEGVLWSYPLTWMITSLLFVIYYVKGHIYDRRYR